jgi:rhodanese-related sulfurtransferase
MRTLAALALVGSVLALPATAADTPADKPADRSGRAAEIAPGLVDAAAARRLVAEGVRVVDVRTPDEYSAGHVPGAVNIPYDQIAQRHPELGPPTTPLLLYCHSGRRSGIAVQILKAKGFTRLYDLQAYDRWVKSEPKGK